eukprot:TRINITY_DN4361_c0_g6_i1.p1 TRINITY_DN4361_c0_g6~~TRINITY_DN4361_c0_g6_i1.p1  ORF type:complete len:324 (+),score=71.17 TRINITY_DN4361_c0_g6_i1:86-1057(+)
MSNLVGFANAPVSKCVVILTAAATIGTALYSSDRRLFVLNLAGIKKLQLWRLISSQFIFLNPAEMILGLILIYTFRQFERQFGSKKFASSLVFFMSFSTLLQLFILFFLPEKANVYMSPGPYAIIFALFAYFRFDIPPSSRFRFFGIPLTDKFFFYLLGAQLLFSRFPMSAYTGLCGLLAGLLYRIEWLPFRHFRIPQAISNCCSRVFSSWFSAGSNAPANPAQHGYAPVMMGGQDAGVGMGEAAAGRQGPYDDQLIPTFPFMAAPHPAAMQPMPPMGALPPPDPAVVRQLVSMGFDEASVRRALALTSNNVDFATHLLVEGR